MDSLQHNKQVRIFACDQQPIVVEGLARILEGNEEFHYLGYVRTLPEAMDRLSEERPEVLLIDQSAELKSIFQFLTDVRSVCPACQPVLWVQELGELDSLRALQAGARGILPRNAPVETLLDCLRTVGRGDVWLERSTNETPVGMPNGRGNPRLTRREKEIVQQVCAGLKNKEIAEALAITAGTVKVHLMHIFEKTGVKDRFELAVQGRRLLGKFPQPREAMAAPSFDEHREFSPL